jgi:hypothetical protein
VLRGREQSTTESRRARRGRDIRDVDFALASGWRVLGLAGVVARWQLWRARPRWPRLSAGGAWGDQCEHGTRGRKRFLKSGIVGHFRVFAPHPALSRGRVCGCARGRRWRPWEREDAGCAHRGPLPMGWWCAPVMNLLEGAARGVRPGRGLGEARFSIFRKPSCAIRTTWCRGGVALDMAIDRGGGRVYAGCEMRCERCDRFAEVEVIGGPRA